MDPPSTPLVRASPDSVRDYTDDENRRLAENLYRLTAQVHAGALSDRRPTEDLLCAFHRVFFDGVRDHGGLIRKPGWGSELMSFGPNVSLHREAVPEALDNLFRELQRSIDSFDASRDDPDYELGAFRLAAWFHAQLIRIHPFEDGNGRCGRLLMDWIMVRLGLRPIPLEAVKGEYLACLNEFFRTGNLDPLADLFLRAYPI